MNRRLFYVAIVVVVIVTVYMVSRNYKGLQDKRSTVSRNKMKELRGERTHKEGRTRNFLQNKFILVSIFLNNYRAYCVIRHSTNY